MVCPHQFLARAAPREVAIRPFQFSEFVDKGAPIAPEWSSEEETQVSEIKSENTQKGVGAQSKSGPEKSRQSVTVSAHLVWSHCLPYTSLCKQQTTQKENYPRHYRKRISVFFDASIFFMRARGELFLQN